MPPRPVANWPSRRRREMQRSCSMGILCCEYAGSSINQPELTGVQQHDAELSHAVLASKLFSERHFIVRRRPRECEKVGPANFSGRINTGAGVALESRGKARG